MYLVARVKCVNFGPNAHITDQVQYRIGLRAHIVNQIYDGDCPGGWWWGHSINYPHDWDETVAPEALPGCLGDQVMTAGTRWRPMQPANQGCGYATGGDGCMHTYTRVSDDTTTYTTSKRDVVVQPYSQQWHTLFDTDSVRSFISWSHDRQCVARNDFSILYQSALQTYIHEI